MRKEKILMHLLKQFSMIDISIECCEEAVGM